MSKIACFLFFAALSLSMVSISFAGGYETQTVFVPGTSESSLISYVENDIKWMYRSEGKDGKFIIDSVMAAAKRKIDTFVFDLNKLTKEGWEVKTSRRAWTDLNGNGEPNYYEWGTEYTLQKKIEEKKKGWW